MTQQLIIPAYFSPTTFPALWVQMQSAPFNSIIIMNPSNGPGSSPDATYQAAVTALQGAGQRVVGYVNTSGVTVPTIEAQIANYVSWYGVNGIFLDQVSGNTIDLATYTTIVAYIHGTTAPLAVLNCGSPPADAGYITIADIICIFENQYAPFTYFTPPSYTFADTLKIANIIYNTSSAQLQQAAYLTVYGYAQYLYITDGSGANPYSGLPSYWTTLLSWVAAGASLGAVLQWFENFESYTVGTATITSPWTGPSNTVISGTIYQSGTKSLGVGNNGNTSNTGRVFSQGDLGPILTVDFWFYIASGNTVNDPPVVNAPIINLTNTNGGGLVQFLVGGAGSYYVGTGEAAGPSNMFSGSVSLNTWHRATWGITMTRQSSGTSYLIIDGGATQTFTGVTNLNSSDCVINQFVATGQFVVGSPVAEVYIDNVSVYRGAFTPAPSGGAAPPFFHMIPAGMVAAGAESLFDGPIPGIAALAIGAGAKIKRVLNHNPISRRRDLLRRILDG